VTVAGSGGTGAYTYNIDGGVFGASGTFGGLAAGGHTVQVKDANGCTSNVAVTITQPTALSGSISSQTNVLCFGSSTGSVTVAGSGGTIAYSYRIDAGVFGASGTFNGLTAGAHTVQVRDANGCTFNVPVSITQPATAVSGSITSQTNVLCFGSATGSVTVAGSGGTGAYTYNIDGGVFGASGTFSALAAGAHTVQVKDANGCTANVNVTITQPASGVSGSITSQTNVLCFGTSTGSVTVAGSNGTGPYTYNIDGGVFGASGTFSALAAGAHTVQVKDANGCTADVAVLLTEPTVLSSLISNTDVTCNGLNNGTATITASGGAAPYTYSKTPFPYQASNVFINLTKNSYTFNTKDANGCISSNNATINEPLALSIPNEIKIDNNICFGDSLGEVRILLVAGGVAPYEYSINGGLNFYPGSIFQNLPAGSYQTQVRDANGCLKNGNLNNISQPARIYINNYTQSDVTNCFGNNDGMIAIEAVGGTGAITYDLDGLVNNPSGIFNSVNGGTHIITMTDTKACSIDTTVNLTEPVEIVFSGLTITDVTGCSGDSNGTINAVASGGAGSFNYSFNGGAYQVGGNFIGLTAGSYTLSARDANLCVKDTIINISEPAPVSILSQSSVNISCASANDGSIIATAAGGTFPYTFVLNPGAVATNATGIFDLLAPGIYSVDVTDNSGCGPVSSLPLTITEPAAVIRDSVISKDISCAGSGNAEIHIYTSGGTSPYKYSIDDGGTYEVLSDYTGLTAGTYHLSVMDAMSCSLNLDTLTFIEPIAITMVSEIKTDIIGCAGDALGEVDFVASGGTGIIEYSMDLLSWQATGHFSGLTAGSYTVTARDQNLCTLNSSVLTITAPASITADITTTPDLNEFNKGSVNIANASGGTGTLVFSITGPAGVFSAQTDYPGLDAGTYPVVVKDDNNCTFEQDAVVLSVPSLDVTVTLTNSTCNGDDDGTITMVCSNGNPPLEYSIDDSTSWLSSGIFTNLSPGTYNIFVRDGLNRYFQDTVQLTDPLDINIFGNITPSSCSSFSGDGAIDVTVNGGSSPYTYMWVSGETTEDLNNLNAGNYHITVTDSKQCNNELSFDLPAVTSVIADAGPDTTICFGATFLLNGQGGTFMSWSPPEGLSNPNISNPVVTIATDAQYILTVVGFNDCVDIDTIDIIVRPEMDLNAGNDTALVKGGEATLVAEGGPFESYSWLPVTGLSTPDQPSTLAHPLATTNYTITVENELGCSQSDTVQVRIAEMLIVYDVFTPNGDTKNDYFDIEYASLYPNILVEVFTRWGEKLFSSTGYNDDQRWDGTFKGKDVPIGTYYYVIVPYNGAEALTGPLTIVR
jgi:gliding motility-associated-like protein